MLDHPDAEPGQPVRVLYHQLVHVRAHALGQNPPQSRPLVRQPRRNIGEHHKVTAAMLLESRHLSVQITLGLLAAR